MDAFEYGRFEAVVHQCSACKQTSQYRHILARHVDSVCSGAHVVTQQCALFSRPVSDQVFPGTNTITGDHNAINSPTNNITINIVPSGSSGERERIVAMFQDPAFVKSLAAGWPEDIPQKIFAQLKGADAPPEYFNIRVQDDTVREYTEGGQIRTLARDAYVKRTAKDLFDSVNSVGPAYTADPVAMDAVHDTLHAPEFTVGASLAKISRFDALRLNPRKKAGLDADGRDFLRLTHRELDRELGYYAAECKPEF